MHTQPTPAAFNRRPFLVARTGFLVNGKLHLGITVDETMSDAQLEEATTATNDRFDRVLGLAEELSPLNAVKYQAVIDSFVERIVMPLCKA